MFRFTKDEIEEAQPREGARYDLRDPREPGLVLTILPSGAKVFYWHRWVAGRTVRERIGSFPEVTIDQARKRARAFNAARTEGRDPAAIRRATREEMTLGELWKFYQNGVEKRASSWRNDKNRWKKYLDPWSARRLSTITSVEVTRLVERIKANGAPVQANRTRALIRAVFNWGIAKEYIKANPVSKQTPRSKENPRDRHLTPAELKRLLGVVAAEPDADLADWVRLLLFTGARSHNVYSMRWEDVDLRERLWVVPPEMTKAGKELRVPLAPVVVELLGERSALRLGGTPWVFPSRRGDAGHLVDLREGFDRLIKAAGIGRLVPHDLRRSFASFAQSAGVPLEVISKSLGHAKVGGVTSVYAQVEDDLVRVGVEWTVSRMLALAAAPEDGANVLTIPVPAWAREAS